MTSYTNGVNVLKLAAHIRDEAIIPQGSLFTERSIWSRPVFEELHCAYVESPDSSSASFEDKLKRQLDGTSDDAKVLFAELLLLNLLILGNVTARRKCDLIGVPLEMIEGNSIGVPSDVVDVLEAGGIINGGMGFNQYRWQAMAFLVDWGLALADKEEAERRALFENSSSIDRLVYETCEMTSKSMQRSLCYLFDPEGHEPITSDAHLKKITTHFSNRIPADLQDARPQRQAAAIRHALAVERGDASWDFYHDRDEWDQQFTDKSSPKATDHSIPALDVDSPAEEQEGIGVEVTFSPRLSASLFVDDNWLSDVREALNSKRQIVLQGPPGTGKTYLARRLAKNATAAKEQVEIVQFHPAYTYEDFFEGFRPQADEGGTAQFVLRKGPLRTLAERATENPDRPYFLVIDEINRGNLAKIFGELYFLLEYRDDQVRLMYSQQLFDLPSNLFIIGTMNTADRSIALVDSAMRRRFAFFTLAPDREPVAGLLARWTAADERYDPQVARLLTALNRQIGNPSVMVGPSYFMQPAAHTVGGLQRIWDTEIIPLLEENLYGEDDVAQRFSLAAIRQLLDGQPETP